MNRHDIDRVIAAYDATVRRNTTPDYEALQAVANDDEGEVGLEVIETAEQLGYSPTTPTFAGSSLPPTPTAPGLPPNSQTAPHRRLHRRRWPNEHVLHAPLAARPIHAR